MADAGVLTAEMLVADLERMPIAEIMPELRRRMLDVLGPRETLLLSGTRPRVVVMTGVNGSGKTTTAGKLAARLAGDGKKVVLGAADTFRAAAAEQLAVWAERSGALLIRHQEGADPGAVAFDAIAAARARSADVVIVDTAGRLQSKRNLMDELAKIIRVTGKALDGAPHEVLLTLDATTGQNSLLQAKSFGLVAGVSGICLTKLDGSAKGGAVLAVRRELGLPVKLVGLGETADDLADFDPQIFVDALLEGFAPAQVEV